MSAHRVRLRDVYQVVTRLLLAVGLLLFVYLDAVYTLTVDNMSLHGGLMNFAFLLIGLALGMAMPLMIRWVYTRFR